MQRLLKYHKKDRIKIFALFLFPFSFFLNSSILIVNRKITFFFGIFFFIFSFFLNGLATTYYIDATNGNDNNDGLSQATAWKTIAKVNSSNFLPGDFILFKRGEIWRELLTVPSSGAPGNPITFGAYGSCDKPIISGADAITITNSFKWTSSDDGINEYYLEKSSGGNPGITKPILLWLDQQNLTEGSAGSLSDHEWDWTDNDSLGYNTVYVRNDSEDPDVSGVLIEAGNRDIIIRIVDKFYITIKDFELRQSDALWSGVVHIYDSYNITFQNCIIHDGHYAPIYMHQSDADPPSGITIDSCIIYGCRRTDSPYGSVIKLDGCNNNIIKNSLIYESNNTSWSDVITLFNSNKNVIEHNEIYGPAGNGIYARPNSDSNIIRYNLIYKITGPAIQIRENSNQNEVYYNIFYENGLAIQSDGDVAINGTKIYNNTIHNTEKNNNGIHVNNTNTECIVKNNIVFVGNGDAFFVHSNSINGVDSDNNCFRNTAGALIIWGGTNYTIKQFSNYQSASGQDSNSITNDPKFANTSNKEFHIGPVSPCINKGTNVGLTKDLRGIPVPQSYLVDIGALEYKANPLPPPTNFRIRSP